VLAHLKASPGKMSFASSGNGSSDHLTAELFWQQTATSGVHIPYKGGGPVMQDLLGGQVDSLVHEHQHRAAAGASAGKLRALAITSATRSPLLPEVPTLAGARHQAVPTSTPGRPWPAPKGLPAEIKAKVHARPSWRP
jgi:tripartite-type tricarboxylate transporter receptor subunit TctC